MNNRYAVITGGTKGIGKAISTKLLKSGYYVIAIYKNDDKNAEKFMKKVRSNKLKLIKSDLANTENIPILVEEIKKISPQIDLLINNAGTDCATSIENTNLTDINTIINTNLLAPIVLTQNMIPLLKRSKSPQIINIASRLGYAKTIEDASIYSATKAGIIQFSKCCAVELAKYKIRVNTISPGFTDTELNRRLFQSSEFWEKQKDSNLIGKICKPVDIANSLDLFISKKNLFINGENIGVNGGSILM